MTNHQRTGAESNTRVGEIFEQKVLKHFEKEIPGLEQPFRLPIGVYRQKPHQFDLGCSDAKVIVECKSHTWTAGGNVPSAKMTTWDQAMLYFLLAPRSYRKIFCVKKDHSAKRKETLCQYYLRTHYHIIPDDVEFWEVDEGDWTFESVEFDLTKP